jgi:hypothetical protein
MNDEPDIREIELADAKNILGQITGRASDLVRGRFLDEVKPKGQFTFELIDADTGDIEERQVLNTVVDEGENEILRWLAGLPRGPVTQTFSGDGSTTQFQLPYPYYPVENVSNVTVDGASKSESNTDFALDYWNGIIYFSGAPSSGTDNVSLDVEYVQHPFRWLAVGTDGSSVADSDTSLGSESERIELDSGTNNGEYTQDASAVEITGTWLFGTGQANISIAEAGLFGLPASAAAQGSGDDTMLNRTVVSPTIDKTSSQELKVTWTLSM